MSIAGFGLTFDFVKFGILLLFLLLMAIYNQRTLMITNKGNIIFFGIGIALRIVECIMSSSINPLLGSLITGVCIGLIALVINIIGASLFHVGSTSFG